MKYDLEYFWKLRAKTYRYIISSPRLLNAINKITDNQYARNILCSIQNL